MKDQNLFEQMTPLSLQGTMSLSARLKKVNLAPVEKSLQKREERREGREATVGKKEQEEEAWTGGNQEEMGEETLELSGAEVTQGTSVLQTFLNPQIFPI